MKKDPESARSFQGKTFMSREWSENEVYTKLQLIGNSADQALRA